MGGSTRVGPWLGVARIIAKRVRGDDEWEGTYCQVGSPTRSARSSSYRRILESLLMELDIRAWFKVAVSVTNSDIFETYRLLCIDCVLADT